MTFLAAHAPDGLLAPKGFPGASHSFLFKMGGRNTTIQKPLLGSRLAQAWIDGRKTTTTITGADFSSDHVEY